MSPSVCGKCGHPTEIVERTLKLEPEEGEALIVDRVALHECATCSWHKPTEPTRRRLLQMLGEHPENSPRRPVKVSMLAPGEAPESP